MLVALVVGYYLGIKSVVGGGAEKAVNIIESALQKADKDDGFVGSIRPMTDAEKAQLKDPAVQEMRKALIAFKKEGKL